MLVYVLSHDAFVKAVAVSLLGNIIWSLYNDNGGKTWKSKKGCDDLTMLVPLHESEIYFYC